MRIIIDDLAFEDVKMGLAFLALFDDSEYSEVYIDGLCFEGGSETVLNDIVAHFGFETLYGV